MREASEADFAAGIDLPELHESVETMAQRHTISRPERDESHLNGCPECEGHGAITIYHSYLRDWDTGEYLDTDEIPCTACDGLGYLTEPATAELDDWWRMYAAVYPDHDGAPAPAAT